MCMKMAWSLIELHDPAWIVTIEWIHFKMFKLYIYNTETANVLWKKKCLYFFLPFLKESCLMNVLVTLTNIPSEQFASYKNITLLLG